MLDYLLGKYLRLEGNWTDRSSSFLFHSSLVDAKRSCLMNGNCFGIKVSVYGVVYSIEFPAVLKFGGNWNIHQKETSLGILIYYIR